MKTPFPSPFLVYINLSAPHQCISPPVAFLYDRDSSLRYHLLFTTSAHVYTYAHIYKEQRIIYH